MKKVLRKLLIAVLALTLILSLAACNDITYQVSFNTDGGSSVSTQTVNEGQKASKPDPDPTKTGYRFDDWYKDSAKTVVFVFGSETINAATTVYAKWLANTYTVAYDKNATDATGATANSSHTYDAAKALTANGFLRDGHTFDGWNTKADGSGTAYTDGQSVTNLTSVHEATVTLHAQWIEGSAVTFDVDGGTAVAPQQVLSGEKAERPATNPTKTGYRFDNWYKADKETLFDFNSEIITGSTVVYAKWLANTYAVAYDVNGGTGTTASSSHVYDVESALTANGFTRDNYAFAGWNTEADGSGTAYTGGQSVTNLTAVHEGTVTLFAQWTENSKFEVSFNVDGGSSVGSQNIYEGGNAVRPATDPEKVGYTFVNWYKADKTTLFDFSSETITSATVVYAVWTANTYSVEYDANGGSGETASSDHIYDTSAALTANGFTNVGYEFAGWNTETDGSGEVYADLAEVLNLTSISGDVVTLYAQWVQLEGRYAGIGEWVGGSIPYWSFEVELDGLGGGFVDAGNSSDQVNWESFINVAFIYTVTGNKIEISFDGEYEDFNGMFDITILPNGNLHIQVFVVEAELVKEAPVVQYEVSFDVDGGSAIVSQNVDEDGYVEEPEDPTKTGYRFDGWYTDNTYATAFDFQDEVINSATVVYAKWLANAYTVAYDRNGATGTTASTSHTYDVESSITTAANPSLTGYNFLGWCLNQDGTGTLYARSAQVLNLTAEHNVTITLYAIWELRSVTVTYNANGGSGEMTQESYFYGTAWTPSACTFTRNGYYFIGYTTTATGSTWRYPGTEYSISTTSNITLYARWAENVTFETDGGSAVTATVNIGEKVTRPATNPTKTGYTFVNWYADKEKTILFDFDNTVITEPTVIYAGWRLNSFAVQYNANGGSGEMSNSAHTNGDDSLLSANAYKKGGYLFAGWNTEADGSGKYYLECALIDYIAESNGAVYELYAQWVVGASVYEAVPDVSVQDAIAAAAANLPLLLAHDGSDGKNNVKPSDSLTAYGITELNYLYSGEVFTGVWQAKVPVSILQAGLVLELYGNGKGYIALGTTDIGWLDYTIVGNTIYLLYHLNITATPTGGDNYATMGTLTINADGSLYCDMSVSGNSVKATIPAANVVKGITINADGTGYLSVIKGVVESNLAFKSTESEGIYTLVHSLSTTDGDNTITYRVVDGNVIVSYKHALKGTSSIGTITSVYTCALVRSELPVVNTVSFDVAGGSAIASQNVYEGCYAVRPSSDPSKVGYTFVNWYKADGTTLFDFDTEIINAATIVYAKWAANTYSVIYDANGGEGEMASSSHIYDEAKALTANGFTRDNYTFIGWNTDAGGLGITYADLAEVTNLMSVDGASITLYAQWIENGQYQVSFNVDGGSAIAPQNVYEGGNAVRPAADPVKVGYTFVNWYKEDGTTLFDFGTETIDAATIVYAKWAANIYSVIYNANGGSGATASSSHTYDEAKALTANDFVKQGYTFAGWATSSGGAVVYANSESIENLSAVDGASVELFAIWTANIYSVIYNANGGTGTTSSSSHTYDIAKVLSANGFVKTGYTFAGWATSSGGAVVYANSESIENLSAVNGDSIELFAIWAANTYSVEYNANGGTGETASSSHTYDIAKVLSANGFVLDNYTFGGWNMQANGSGVAYANLAEVLNLTAVDGGIVILYAQWIENDRFEVSFNVDGGSSVVSQSIYDGKLALRPQADPVKEGYTFVNWYKEDGTTLFDFDNEVINSATVVYAKWTAHVYSVVFDKNNADATGEMATVNRAYDDGVALGSSFLLTGRTLSGWNTKADGTGTAYAAGSTANLTADNGVEITLYAQWTANTYTVTYNRNSGSSGAQTTATYTYGVAFTLTTTTGARSGYQFVGLSLSNDGSSGLYALGASVINLASEQGATLTMYYIYARRATLNANGSGETAITDDSAIVAGSATSASYTLPVCPFTRAGYTFVGWGSNAAGANVYQPGEVRTLTAATTFYAQWVMNVTFDADGGSAVTGQAVVLGGTASAPTAPTRTGYTFGYWYLGDSETPFDFDTEISVVTVLKAKWIANTYSVRFDGNGSSDYMSDQSFTYDDAAKALSVNTFVRDGFTFVGWNTLASGLGVSYANVAEVSNLTSEANGVFTLYAQWIISNYTVSYDANGGENGEGGAMTSDVRAFNDDEALTANTYVKVGYRFNGWNTAADGTGFAYANEFVGDINTSVPSVTLYAQWLVNTYTVTYNRNGASGTTSSTSHTYDVTRALATTSVTRSGYTMVGLCLDSSGNGTIYALGASVINLTAEHDVSMTMYYIWARVVTLNANGGAESNATVNVIMAGSATSANYILPANTFTRNGYIFAGWGTTAAGGTIRQAGEEVTISAATTFYAQWSPTLTFDTGGGSSVPVPEFENGSKISRPVEIPTKDGYVFDNWYKDSELTELFDFETEGVVYGTVIYAGWIANSYTVVYNANGGEGSMMNNSRTYDDGDSLDPNSFTRVGYEFTGWNTEADGSGVSYADNAVANLTEESGVTVILYAQWFDSAVFGTYSTTRIVSTTDGAGLSNVPDSLNKIWPVLNKADLDTNLLWNGEIFSGVYTLGYTYIIVGMAIRVEIYGDGNGLLMIGSGGSNGGRFTYTISGNTINIAYQNETPGNTDALATASFTIYSTNSIYVGSLVGYTVNKMATKGDNIRELTINADGTGTLTTSVAAASTTASDTTTVTNITWTIVNATTLNIMNGSTLLCTVSIQNDGTIQISYYRTVTQGSSTTWTTITSAAAKTIVVPDEGV